MKKITKNKQNWFKLKFKKHPYLFTFLIGWPILFYIIVEFIDPIVRGFDEVLLIIFFLFPPIIFFLWFRKNKSKIKRFYKRNKKIFNRIYFYLGSVFSLIPIACIVGIIATGGVSNFIERTKFEINAAIFTYNKHYLCQAPFLIAYTGYPKEFRIYFFKEQTQYLDYFENEIEPYVLKDLDFLNVNHCTGTRYLLKKAQEGNEAAKEILVAYPPELREIYAFPFKWYGKTNKYIFSRYEKNIANMDLDNPAIAYSYAAYLDENIYRRSFKDVEPIKPEALKYLKQSAEDGYFLSMITWILIYSDENNFNQNNCDTYLKYFNTLADNNSLIPYYMLIQGYMGKLTSPMPKTVFKCLNQKPNFSKAFSMLSNHPQIGSSYTKRMSSNFLSSYPAIFYLYGLGDVEQDYDKAYELFSYGDDNYGIPDQAYLAYMNFMGMGVEQNPNKGIGLTIELAKKVPITKTQKDSLGLKLPCGGVNYNFIIPELPIPDPDHRNLSKNERRKHQDKYLQDLEIEEKTISEYRAKLGQCILDSDPEVSIKFLEDYIFNRVSDFFKNPELVKTLNYLGEPK